MIQRQLFIPSFKMRHLVGRSHRTVNRICEECCVSIDLEGPRQEFPGSRMVFQVVTIEGSTKEQVDQAERACMASITRETIQPRVVGNPIQGVLPPRPGRGAPDPYAPSRPRPDSPPYAPRSPAYAAIEPTYGESSPPYVPRDYNEGEGEDEAKVNK